MRLLIFVLSLLAAAPAASQSAPAPTVSPSTAAQNVPADQRPKHLVVINKLGPNYAKLSEMRPQALAHRQIYLDLTAAGDILVSGRLEGEPSMGITVFRHGVDEARIRKLLADDPITKAGVLQLEFRYWSIQMGGFGNAAKAQ